MQVAQVCPRYHPYIGGVETVVKEIGERLVQKGFKVEVLSQDPLGKYPSIENINGVTVRRFKTGPLGWDFAFSNNTLRNFLNENSHTYDLIHGHSYHAFPALYAAWAKGENKLVFNPYYHGKGHNLLMTLFHIPYRQVGKVIFKRADNIICISETEKSLAQRHFAASGEKIIVISPGVSLERIANAGPVPLAGKLILCPGRLEKYKNTHLAIKAMPYLQPEYRLTIIGNGPYKEKLSQLIEKLNLADRVQILSGLSNEEVYCWYKTCNLVLNLSSQESFGLTVIEGLAAGKPVIVNSQPALAELTIKFDQVYSVEAEKLSPLQLAREIALGCDREAFIPDLSEYSWDSIAERIKNLYESLL
ncbi:MAG: D-inositol 3-phosphate glycosyltransferase [candidate division WS2 bacterium]|nr:D-inositol 3-phosphate glycosyltransferase [Candidatus Psychracetigena formicireducens]